MSDSELPRFSGAELAALFGDDVFSTPTIYILDKNHKIIARRLGVDDLEPFIILYKKQHENKNLSESNK